MNTERELNLQFEIKPGAESDRESAEESGIESAGESEVKPDKRTREILRYLGDQKGKEQEDKAVLELISSCVAELEAGISPKHIYREFPLQVSGETIDGGCFQTKSKALGKNLKDCESIILFAATLGTGTDYLLGRYSRIKMSRAVVMQAAATALLEEYCDRICRQLSKEYEKQERFLRPRFSPGYGDFSLEIQPKLLDALEAGKRLGIKLTDSLLMLPSKSVTAVLGVSKIPGICRVQGCEVCLKEDCLYRR